MRFVKNEGYGDGWTKVLPEQLILVRPPN